MSLAHCIISRADARAELFFKKHLFRFRDIRLIVWTALMPLLETRTLHRSALIGGKFISGTMLQVSSSELYSPYLNCEEWFIQKKSF